MPVLFAGLAGNKVLKFILKSAIVIILLLLAAAGYAVYSYKAKLERTAQELIIAGARQSNINLSFEEFGLNFIGAKAKAINFFIPKIFLSLRIDEPRIELPILSAMMLKPGLNVLGKFYESEFDAHAAYHITSKQAQGRLALHNLDLSKVTQLAFIGIVEGRLNFTLDDLIVTPDGLPAFTSKLTIENLQSTGERRFSIRIKGQNQQIVIPPVSNLNMIASASMDKDKLRIVEAELKSDLGNANCTGEINTEKISPGDVVNLRLIFNLSAKGMNYFGYLLPLISNNILSESSSSFKLDINGSTHNLKYTFRPV